MPEPTPEHGTVVDLEVLSVNYFLDVGNDNIASFYRLEGGDMSVNYIKHDVVLKTGEATTWLIPTTTSFSPITLARGFGNSAYLYNWFSLAANGRIFEARRHCSIRVMSFIEGVFTPITYFHLYDAWISKIEGFTTNQYDWSSAAEMVVTLVPESIQRIDEKIDPPKKKKLAYELSPKAQRAAAPLVKSARELLAEGATRITS